MKAFAWSALLAAFAAFGASAREFNQVDPFTFDPKDTDLVAARWIHGIGCPPGDAGCPTGDRSDKDNAGLLLVKTGATANDAAAGAELKNVSGITLTELGYDIRSGSHCGAGAPRFNVVTTDNVTHFVGCASPPPAVMARSAGWMRLRWLPAEAFPPIASPVKSISIVFDEGQDVPGDGSGSAILDNVDVNGKIVGR
ncbi:MAG TPA: hypothetical protein VE964_00735 [Myxococcales bacterium]|nr:hypothetical protein [Myxococcales bacterium]